MFKLFGYNCTNDIVYFPGYYATVCYSMLQCATVCYSVLRMLQYATICFSSLTPRLQLTCTHNIPDLPVEVKEDSHDGLHVQMEYLTVGQFFPPVFKVQARLVHKLASLSHCPLTTQ